ncbi:MAG: lysylphosphatidylglycerol synthase domain-containing protein [Gaiellaceae bacterium]
MGFAVVVLVVLLATAGGSIVVAALALTHVLVGWGVLFFYALPAIFFSAWIARELAPDLWRRAATPLRWSWRRSVLAAPARPAPPLPPLRVRAPVEPNGVRGRLRHVLERLLRPWMLEMRLFLSAWRTPRVRRILNIGFGVAAVGILALVAEGFHRVGWPLHHTDSRLAAAAGALFLSAFGLKAFGWQRLFRPADRPRSLTLATATGAAAVIGLALPGRFDDAVRVAIVRRLPGRTPSVGTLVLSLFLLGMIDAGALAPFAVAAAIAGPTGVAVRAAMGIVAGGGVGATLVVAALPRLRAHDRLGRYRLTHWLGRHIPDSPRDAAWAWALVAASWVTRAVGIFLLLEALGFGVSFTLAASYLAAGAASAALPISPAGAATQAGVGAAVLASAGVAGEQAVAFSVAAQALTILAGATVVVFAGILHALTRLRPSSTAW